MINTCKRALGLIRDEKGFDGNFDSHYFIKRFRAHNEACYLKIIDKYKDEQQDNKAIMRANAEVARMLRINAKELGIRQCGKVRSMNDHGNNTFNKLWRIVVLFILFVPIGFNATSQTSDQFDLPTRSMVEEYKFVVDESYIYKIMVELDFINKYINTVSFQSTYGYNVSDLTIDSSLVYVRTGMTTQEEIKALFDKFKVINNVKLKRSFFRSRTYYETNDLLKLKESIQEYEKHIKKYIGVYKDDENPIISKWPINADVQIIDKIPVIKKRTFSEEDIKEYERQLRQNDRNKFYEGYEWIFGKRQYVNQTFPEKGSFYQFEEHPEYAYIESVTINPGAYTQTTIEISGLFDKTGRFIRNLNPEVDRKDAWKEIQWFLCIQDFNNNKYDIQSYGKAVVLSVERLLLYGEWDEYQKLNNESVLLWLKVKIKEAKVALNPYQFQKELDDAMEEYNNVERKLNEFNKTALSYVEQLINDHPDKVVTDPNYDAYLHDGRLVRKDDTSFYFSFVDKKGKMVYLLLIQDIQDGKFNIKRKISVVQ